MKCLYVTADKINEANTGGGQVTGQELEFFKEMGDVDILNPSSSTNPFETDTRAMIEYKTRNKKYDIAHFYAGTFSTLIKVLKEDGTRVSYTCAAHDIDVSAEEHKKYGGSFDYPHLVEPELRERYLQGYRDADLVITPSTYSRDVCERYGCHKFAVVPHGIHELPSKMKPCPSQFSVAYLGSLGWDKGLVYLLRAWKLLGYKDHTLKIAGRGSEQLLWLVREHGGGKIYLSGFAQNVSDIYNGCSVYVQPSATEGFGIEILEAMAHGRPVISSTNNAGPDIIENNQSGKVVEARNVAALADAIDFYQKHPVFIPEHGERARVIASKYTWAKVKDKYLNAWRSL